MNKSKNAKSMKKPAPVVAAANSQPAIAPDDNFVGELLWCVQDLERSLCSGKLSQKVAEDKEKHLKVLKSSTAPFVKKRQVMKAALGDYRAKMAEEEKTMALDPKQICFSEPPKAKARFFRYCTSKIKAKSNVTTPSTDSKSANTINNNDSAAKEGEATGNTPTTNSSDSSSPAAPKSLAHLFNSGNTFRFLTDDYDKDDADDK